MIIIIGLITIICGIIQVAVPQLFVYALNYRMKRPKEDMSGVGLIKGTGYFEIIIGIIMCVASI